MTGEEINCNGCNTKVQNCTVATKCPGIDFFRFFSLHLFNHTQKNNQFTYTNLTSISVDCQWSEWSSSECTAPCGSGTLTKERTSKLPKEKLNETPSCMHKLVLVENCNEKECPGKMIRTFEF